MNGEKAHSESVRKREIRNLKIVEFLVTRLSSAVNRVAPRADFVEVCTGQAC